MWAVVFFLPFLAPLLMGALKTVAVGAVTNVVAGATQNIVQRLTPQPVVSEIVQQEDDYLANGYNGYAEEEYYEDDYYEEGY